MTENLELFKFTRLYLGQMNWKLIKETSENELKLFQKIPIDVSKSYIVFGNLSTLSKFRAFYLTRCIKKRPLYSQYSMYEYASELSSSSKDEYGLNVDQDLIFLYRHEHAFSLGNSETWLVETILNKVADRNRDGLVTIILSEMRMPALEESGELEFINLSGKITAQAVSNILKSSKKDQNVNGEFTDYD